MRAYDIACKTVRHSFLFPPFSPVYVSPLFSDRKYNNEKERRCVPSLSAHRRPDNNKGPRVIAATDPRPSRPGPVHLRAREFIHKCPRASCDGAKALAPEVCVSPPLFGTDVPIALFPEGATGCDPFASKTTRGPHAAERRAKKISITYVRFSDETVERDRHGENGESIVGSAGSRYQSIDTRNVSWSGYKVSVCTRVIACVTTRDDG